MQYELKSGALQVPCYNTFYLPHFLTSSLPLHRSPKHRQQKTMYFSASQFKALDIQGMFEKPVSKSERTQDMRSSCWSSNTLIPITNPNCYFECSSHQILGTEPAHSFLTRPIYSAISTQKPFEGLQKRNEVNVVKKSSPCTFRSRYFCEYRALPDTIPKTPPAHYMSLPHCKTVVSLGSLKNGCFTRATSVSRPLYKPSFLSAYYSPIPNIFLFTNKSQLKEVHVEKRERERDVPTKNKIPVG